MNNKNSSPTFYPTASRAFIGYADESLIIDETIAILQKIPRFVDIFNGRAKLKDTYIKDASGTLVFDFEVVKDRGADSLPYEMGRIVSLESYDPSAVVYVPPPQKVSGPGGRINPEREIQKHENCHVKKSFEKVANAQTTKEEFSNERKNLKDAEKKKFEKAIEQAEKAKSFKSKHAKREPMKWDEFLMTQLSKNTARWLLTQQATSHANAAQAKPQFTPAKANAIEAEKRRLFNFVDQEIGFVETTDLVADTVSECAEEEGEGLAGDNRHTEAALSRDFTVSSMISAKDRSKGQAQNGIQPLPPGEKMFRNHYLLGDNLSDDIELNRILAGTDNETALGITVAPCVMPHPPTLKDIMPRAVGDKVFETDNQFVQEMLAGARPIIQRAQTRGQDEIALDSGNVYTLSKTITYPGTRDPGADSDSVQIHVSRKGTQPGGEQSGGDLGAVEPMGKGRWREWTRLPELKQDYREIESGRRLDLNSKDLDPYVPLDREGRHRAFIVEKWLKSYHLGSMWRSSTVGEVQRSLRDIDEQTRLEATAVCAKGAVYRLEKEESRNIYRQKAQEMRGAEDGEGEEAAACGIELEAVGSLPDGLREALEQWGLEDPSLRVRMGASLAIFMLGENNEKCADILNKVVREGTPEDQVVASLCLCNSGYCNSSIVEVFINLLLLTSDECEFNFCMEALEKLSDSTTLVHSLVGEQLNSNSWKARFMACKILPRLKGSLNKDITNKLIHMMWHDWSPDNKAAAAQALGKLGHGQEVHEKIRNLLMNGSELQRVDALNRLGHLGLMTNKMLALVMKCFDDEYISVRVEACIVVGKLHTNEEEVIDVLLRLTQFDPSWKVKSHAIKALTQIGISRPEICSAIVWAFRYETHPAVRAEGAHAIPRLGMKGEQVVKDLQERLLVEPDDIVIKEIKESLEWLGQDPTGDLEMVQRVKDEVRRLCTTYNISHKILSQEAELGRIETLNTLIYRPPPPQAKKSHAEPRELKKSLEDDLEEIIARPFRESTPCEQDHLSDESMHESGEESSRPMSERSISEVSNSDVTIDKTYSEENGRPEVFDTSEVQAAETPRATPQPRPTPEFFKNFRKTPTSSRNSDNGTGAATTSEAHLPGPESTCQQDHIGNRFTGNSATDNQK